jgi:hypothetical protein
MVTIKVKVKVKLKVKYALEQTRKAYGERGTYSSTLSYLRHQMEVSG